MKQQVTVNELCEIFEIDPAELPDMCNIKSYEDAVRKVRIFKNIFRKQRKKLAMRYHPDKTGGDHDKLALINTMFDRIMTVRAVRHEPVFENRGWSTANTSSTTMGDWRHY